MGNSFQSHSSNHVQVLCACMCIFAALDTLLPNITDTKQHQERIVNTWFAMEVGLYPQIYSMSTFTTYS